MNAMPPDARAAAQPEIEALRANPSTIDQRLQRVLGDCPEIEPEVLLAGLDDFHRERMQRVPSSAKYPEALPWVEHTIEVDRLVQETLGLSHRQMAIQRSLNDYLAFRGHVSVQPSGPEKCRVAWIPDTDQGPLHIKNVDDPMPANWPLPHQIRRPASYQEPPLVWDGVGSGLHIDDEPEEIFPLPVREMCRRGCTSVPDAVDFLQRYKPFWGRQNVVLRDQQGNAVAIEKSSFNHMECFEPNTYGRVWVSGMVTRDPDSPQGQYVRRMRHTYLDRFGLGTEGPDSAFWARCDRAEQMLRGLLTEPGPLRVDHVFKLFLTPWPNGLNKDGDKAHPDQPSVQYTLVTHGTLTEQRRTYRYVRSGDTKRMPETPEVIEWD